MPENPAAVPMQALHYGRHFAVLGCLIGAVAATSGGWPNLGLLARFGIYAALHASAITVAWRGRQPYWRPPLVVSVAVAQSMLSAAVARAVDEAGWFAPVGASAALALAAGLGAAAYALLLRYCGARLGSYALATLPLCCVLATHAVLVLGIFRHGGVWWFAAAWWMAFSVGLWFWDGRETTSAAKADPA